MWLVFGSFVFLTAVWMNTHVFWEATRGILFTNEYLLTLLRNINKSLTADMAKHPRKFETSTFILRGITLERQHFLETFHVLHRVLTNEKKPGTHICLYNVKVERNM
jgi:hypothetical protein